MRGWAVEILAIGLIRRQELYLTKADYDESYEERVLWEDRERINSEEVYRRTYQSNSGALYFAQSSSADETWLPLLEKCYAKTHGDYAAIEGGFGGEAIEDLVSGLNDGFFFGAKGGSFFRFFSFLNIAFLAATTAHSLP